MLQNIRHIVEQIVAAEKSDIRLAFVEYRDHPPQDSTFVTRTHDFTDSVKTMKKWLDESSTFGGRLCHLSIYVYLLVITWFEPVFP